MRLPGWIGRRKPRPRYFCGCEVGGKAKCRRNNVVHGTPAPRTVQQVLEHPDPTPLHPAETFDFD